MAEGISPSDAVRALDDVDRRRSQILAEIDVPSWYWWGLAAGWVGLGLVTVVGKPWLSVAATVGFGAAHASIAHRVIDGRHGSGQLSVRADLVGRHVRLLVIGFLLVLIAVTVAVALAADALGAPQPVLIASLVVAVAVLFGGPQLMAAVRRRAERSAAR
jgi:membrane protein implicated in regulation of membrane protease activity